MTNVLYLHRVPRERRLITDKGFVFSTAKDGKKTERNERYLPRISNYGTVGRIAHRIRAKYRFLFTRLIVTDSILSSHCCCARRRTIARRRSDFREKYLYSFLNQKRTSAVKRIQFFFNFETDNSEYFFFFLKN